MTGGQTVASVQTCILDIPLIRPHKFSVLSVDTQATLLVRLTTEDGIVGIGEGVVPGGPWWGGESIEGMQALVERYLTPLLLGEDALRVDHLARRMDRAVAGAPFAKAALEMALWDVAGKASGLPLHRLLGGAHRDSLPVTWALGADPVQAVVAEATAKLDDGTHQAFKLKMGALPPPEDVARVQAITEALRDRASVAVDLNGSWDERTARRWLPELAAAGVQLIEQPVAGWNVGAMARLRDCVGVSIMADEALRTPQDAQLLVTEHAADVFAVKIAKSGGIGALQRIAAIADAGGVACYGGTTIETSIGTAAAAHAYCASAPLTAGTELFGPLLLADDVVEDPVRYANGRLHLTDGPGLGVSIDEEKVRKYTRR